jgi:type IV pilus assembly protein PilE
MHQAGTEASRAYRQTGVTLIELMIVVVVVGILASIAYPSYQQYILRSKRTEGKALLMDIVARQERFYMDRNSYTDDLTALGFSSEAPKSAEGNYAASVAAGASADIETSYEVTVSPQWPGGDPECGDLTLDSRGSQGSTTGSMERCWR